MRDVTLGEPVADRVVEQVAEQVAEHRGLALLPFHGVRYAGDRVADLAGVTSPPYDVLDADGVLALESADAHNVVRLILPRADDCGPEGRYEHAASTLRSWLLDGVLRVDERAGLYVYEQDAGGAAIQRGLLGNIGLRDPSERIVLPHEDVMAGPVADRLELMRAARANVEPILLMYDGGSGPTAAIVAKVAAGRPLATTETSDGLTHRLWQLADADDLGTIAADLAGRQALIADGHHRYAAYRALQSEYRSARGPGPWDSGLALLVDLRAYPPHVGAIHRVVNGLSLDTALRDLDALFTVVAVDVPDAEQAAAELHSGELLVLGADGTGARLTVRDQRAVDELIARDQPEQWRHLDTAVLHHVLVDHLWRVADDQVGYHHDVPGAMRSAARSGGLAVLLAPVTVESVLDLAAQGVRMPRKSTSFGPKPRTGLVLRTFDSG
jgi:uncharacterized protein (DUF1015 family)